MTDPSAPDSPETVALAASPAYEMVASAHGEEFADRAGSKDAALQETTVSHGVEAARARRRHAIRHAGDGLEGVWGPDYLKELREDWPE